MASQTCGIAGSAPSVHPRSPQKLSVNPRPIGFDTAISALPFVHRCPFDRIIIRPLPLLSLCSGCWGDMNCDDEYIFPLILLRFALFKYLINCIPAANTYHANDNLFFFDLVNQSITRGLQLNLVVMLIAPDPCAIDVGIFKPAAQMRFES